MADRAGERAIFELFLRTKPDFAGEPLRDWSQPLQDPPDILCETVSGRKIGAKLGEWLNEVQMSRAKGLEAIQESILAAIGRQPDNDLENVYYAQIASEFVRDDPGVFDNIFLLLAFEPGQRMFQLYPP